MVSNQFRVRINPASNGICNALYNPSSGTKLYYGGTQYEGDRTNLDHVTETGFCSTVDCPEQQKYYGYITEGVPSSVAGKLNTTTKVIPSPGQPQLDSESDASTTSGTLWEHFFEGSQINPRPRHPGVRYCETSEGSGAPGCSGS